MPPDPNAKTASGLSPPASNVTVTNGGTVTSADGSASVAFTPRSVGSDLAVSVAVGATAPGGIEAVGQVYTLTATGADGSQVDTFASAPTLTIHYDPSGPTPTAIYYLDPVKGPTWIPGTVDATAHTISAALPHFSDYVAVAVDPSGDGALTATYTDDGTTKTFALVRTGVGTIIDSAVLAAASDPVAITLTGAAQLTISGSNLTGYTGTIMVTGSNGDDRYIFGDDWGTVVLASPDAGKDTLDFSTVSQTVRDLLTVSADKSVLGDGTNTVTQSTTPADQAEEINIVVSYATPPSALVTNLQSAYNKLSQLVDSLDATVHALSNALPLIDPNAGASISKIVALVDDIKALRDKVNPKLAELTSSSDTTLADIVAKLTSAVGSLPAVLSGLKFTTDYRGAADSKLEVLIDVDLPTATVNKTIPLSLGPDVAALGVTLETTSGAPVTLSVAATLAIHISIGLPAAGPSSVFLAPGGTVSLTVGATLAAGTLKINLSLLEGSIPRVAALVQRQREPDAHGSDAG